MGLIRSGNTSLTPMSCDRELTVYLWPIIREIVKTVSMGCKNEEGEAEYAGFILVADYEDGRICFNITINQNMELMEFLVR